MAIVKMTDICKDYYQGKEPVRVLKNVDLTVERGDYLAIMGPSGSGKTTLMNLIGCLDVPTSGEYLLDDQNLKDLSDNALADIRNKHIGFVFQSFHLLPKMDALDNVALPLLYAGVPLKERRERAEAALNAVGLSERIHFLPNQLSGGQCQRVAIARAMVGNPDILLADEPTGALDTKSGNQIMDIFRQLSDQGMTILMITHDMHLMLEYTPHAIVINSGKKIGDDTAVSILTNAEIAEKASLKLTSLYDLAVSAGIDDAAGFVQHFIDYEREVYRHEG